MHCPKDLSKTQRHNAGADYDERTGMLISTAKGAKDDNRKNNRRGRNRDTKPRTICGMFWHHDRCKHASVRWLAPTRGATNPATACSSRNNSSSWHWTSNPENGHSRWLSCAPLTRHRRRSRPNFHSRSRSLAHHPPRCLLHSPTISVSDATHAIRQHLTPEMRRNLQAMSLEDFKMDFGSALPRVIAIPRNGRSRSH